MKTLRTFAAALCWMTVATAFGQTEVKVEFFTPSIVHVVKGQPTKTLVITATPERGAGSKSGNTWKSSELTVKQDAQGRLTFLTAKGKVLLREKGDVVF